MEVTTFFDRFNLAKSFGDSSPQVVPSKLPPEEPSVKECAVLECDYDGLPSSNPLYYAIEKKNWVTVRLMMSRTSDLEREAQNLCFFPQTPKAKIPDCRRLSRAWMSRKNADGTVKWRITLLHGAVLFGAPTDILRWVMDSHRSAVSLPDDRGNLPLHLAFKNGLREESLNVLLEAYPQAMDIKNESGLTPLDCLLKGCKREKQSALMGYIIATKGKHDRELQSVHKLFADRLRKVEGAVRAEQEQLIEKRIKESIESARAVLIEAEQRLRRELATSLIQEARDATGYDIKEAALMMETRMNAADEVRAAAENAKKANDDVEAAAAELMFLESQIEETREMAKHADKASEAGEEEKKTMEKNSRAVNDMPTEPEGNEHELSVSKSVEATIAASKDTTEREPSDPQTFEFTLAQSNITVRDLEQHKVAESSPTETQPHVIKPNISSLNTATTEVAKLDITATELNTTSPKSSTLNAKSSSGTESNATSLDFSKHEATKQNTSGLDTLKPNVAKSNTIESNSAGLEIWESGATNVNRTVSNSAGFEISKTEASKDKLIESETTALKPTTDKPKVIEAKITRTKSKTRQTMTVESGLGGKKERVDRTTASKVETGKESDARMVAEEQSKTKPKSGLKKLKKLFSFKNQAAREVPSGIGVITTFISFENEDDGGIEALATVASIEATPGSTDAVLKYPGSKMSRGKAKKENENKTKRAPVDSNPCASSVTEEKEDSHVDGRGGDATACTDAKAGKDVSSNSVKGEKKDSHVDGRGGDTTACTDAKAGKNVSSNSVTGEKKGSHVDGRGGDTTACTDAKAGKDDSLKIVGSAVSCASNGNLSTAVLGDDAYEGAVHRVANFSLMDLSLATSCESSAEAGIALQQSLVGSTEELKALLEQHSEYARNTQLYKWLQGQKEGASETLQEKLIVPIDELRTFLKGRGSFELPESTELYNWFRRQEQIESNAGDSEVNDVKKEQVTPQSLTLSIMLEDTTGSDKCAVSDDGSVTNE